MSHPPALLFKLSITLENGKDEVLAVFAGDSPAEVASRFVAVHGLPRAAVSQLMDSITANLQAKGYEASENVYQPREVPPRREEPVPKRAQPTSRASSPSSRASAGTRFAQVNTFRVASSLMRVASRSSSSHSRPSVAVWPCLQLCIATAEIFLFRKISTWVLRIPLHDSSSSVANVALRIPRCKSCDTNVSCSLPLLCPI